MILLHWSFLTKWEFHDDWRMQFMSEDFELKYNEKFWMKIMMGFGTQKILSTRKACESKEIFWSQFQWAEIHGRKLKAKIQMCDSSSQIFKLNIYMVNESIDYGIDWRYSKKELIVSLESLQKK